MHGNVWEWCADHWHDNYIGAPTDGSAWLYDNHSDNKVYNQENYGLLRGGSWLSGPEYCRSRSRNYYNPALWLDIDASVGFRVVCGCAWTP
ncbi:MAG: SUMF1/EgtB/PvdO family nonheme iron enzyme [Moorea sp. SIO3C2]|nr:SUMF1/EgtB/PvdO family nonheme iron enzyme [Moorena sp. SIO3C2]